MKQEYCKNMNQYKFEDIISGMEESFTIQITEEMMDSFLKITGDVNPLHNDEDYAREKGFSSRVVYGMLTASFLSTLAGVFLPGKYCLIHGIEAEFPKPVYIGDILTVTGTVAEKDERFREFKLRVVIRNERREKVCRAKMRLGVKE